MTIVDDRNDDDKNGSSVGRSSNRTEASTVSPIILNGTIFRIVLVCSLLGVGVVVVVVVVVLVANVGRGGRVIGFMRNR